MGVGEEKAKLHDDIKKLLSDLNVSNIPNLDDEDKLRSLQSDKAIVATKINAFNARFSEGDFKGSALQIDWHKCKEFGQSLDLKLEDIEREQESDRTTSDRLIQESNLEQREKDYIQNLKDYKQRTGDTLRKRTDDAGVNFRRFITGINSGGIIVSLYIGKTLLENKINPLDEWIIIPITIFFCGLLVTGASNWLQKWKRKQDEDANKIEIHPIDWNNIKVFKYFPTKNTNYEITSFLFFVAGFILIACIVSKVEFDFDIDKVEELKAEVVNYKAEVVNYKAEVVNYKAEVVHLKHKAEIADLKTEVITHRKNKRPDIIDSDSKNEPEAHKINKSTASDSL